MATEGNLARVSIFGHEYTVKAEADGSYIADVAKYVDQKMREVEEQLPSSPQSTSRIAILAAMSITDDYFAEKNKLNKLVNDVEEKALTLSEALDENIPLY